MKILAIDHGTKRIGLAISDELGISCKILPSITVKNDRHAINQIEKVISSEKPDKVLIGLPYGPEGKDSTQTIIVREFATVLSKNFNMPIIFWDEAYSSKIAFNNIKGKKKPNLDSEAAKIILQEYLNSI